MYYMGIVIYYLCICLTIYLSTYLSVVVLMLGATIYRFTKITLS